MFTHSSISCNDAISRSDWRGKPRARLLLLTGLTVSKKGDQMQYMMMIYHEEDKTPASGTAEYHKMMAEFGAFSQEMEAKGIIRGGTELQSVETATTVRVRAGKTETTDGPFAETKEILGGFYLLECSDLDEAIEYAARIPVAKFGSIEVRPAVAQ